MSEEEKKAFLRRQAEEKERNRERPGTKSASKRREVKVDIARLQQEWARKYGLIRDDLSQIHPTEAASFLPFTSGTLHDLFQVPFKDAGQFLTYPGLDALCRDSGKHPFDCAINTVVSLRLYDIVKGRESSVISNDFRQGIYPMFTAHFIGSVVGYEIENIFFDETNISAAFEKIKTELKPGFATCFGMNVKGMGAHIIVIFNLAGKIYFFDPQPGLPDSPPDPPITFAEFKRTRESNLSSANLYIFKTTRGISGSYTHSAPQKKIKFVTTSKSNKPTRAGSGRSRNTKRSKGGYKKRTRKTYKSKQI